MAGTIIITGANGSIALAAVDYLLQNFPEYTLLLTVRNASQDGDANTKKLHEVVAQHANARATISQLDLSSLASVQEFAEHIAGDVAKGSLPPVSSVVCNAFYWNLARPMETTGDGFETTFQITHLAHAALILHLIKGNAFQRNEKARIVLFASDAIFPGQNKLEKLPPGIPESLEDLAHPGPDGKDDSMAYGFRRYANAKLAATMWGFALNRYLEKDPKLNYISAVVMNPGNISDSRALRVNTPPMIQRLSKYIIQPLRPLLRFTDSTMRTATEAAKDVAMLAMNKVHPDMRGYVTLLKQSQGPPESLDEKKQDALWTKTAEWAGVSLGDDL